VETKKYGVKVWTEILT